MPSENKKKEISFIRGVKILTSSSKNFSISFWLSVKYWTGFCVIARRPMKSLNTSVPWHVYIGFWQNINKSLPHVQTFHRVSFGILFCGKNHLPRICTFLSKTQPCSNSGERSNKIPCQVFFCKLTSQGRGALVALKQWRQLLLMFSLMSGHNIETLGSSTQIISPAYK